MSNKKDKALYIRVSQEDKEIIDRNKQMLSYALGKRFNLSAFIVHVLKNTKSKRHLFDYGFISLVEYHENTTKKLPPHLKFSNRKKYKKVKTA